MSDKVRPVEIATALELATAIIQQIPRDISQEQALAALQSVDNIADNLRALLMPEPSLTDYETYWTEAVDGLILSELFSTDRKNSIGIKLFTYLTDTFCDLRDAASVPISVPAGVLRVSRLEQRANTEQIWRAVSPDRRFKSFADAAAAMSVMLQMRPLGIKPGKIFNNKKNSLFVFDEGVITCRFEYYGDDYSHGVIGVEFLSRLNGSWGEGNQVVSY